MVKALALPVTPRSLGGRPRRAHHACVRWYLLHPLFLCLFGLLAGGMMPGVRFILLLAWQGWAVVRCGLVSGEDPSGSEGVWRAYG